MTAPSTQGAKPNKDALWNTPAGKAMLQSFAAHEAGHAVARWHLDRTRFVARHFVFPHLRHVAISREGEPLPTKGGDSIDLGGVCSGDPCVMLPAIPLDMLVQAVPEGDTKRMLAFRKRGNYADLIHTMAGPIAEHIYLAASEGEEEIRDAWDWLNTLGDEYLHDEDDEDAFGSDWWQVTQRIPLLGRRWRLHLERAFEAADKIVRDHQPHIAALAAALLERGFVDGEEVYRIFEQASEGKRQ